MKLTVYYDTRVEGFVWTFEDCNNNIETSYPEHWDTVEKVLQAFDCWNNGRGKLDNDRQP